ncbi:MAG TPA: YraN family protein [Firmicutes bacterium]|nr:MAG: hypothetical protein DRH44_01205 [Candidatus Coatesbacteria bacterium]HEC79744.1 YraN family protein [Bacillota bacterium]
MPENISYSKKTGSIGEDAVCDLLISRGIEILSRNYQAEGGEIDIIGTDGEVLIICEVKTVSEKSNRNMLDYIDRKQWERIIKTAELYMAENFEEERPIRYDLALVKIKEQTDYEIEYLQSFFTTDYL